MTHLEGRSQELNGSSERVQTSNCCHLQLRVGRVLQGGHEVLHQVVGVDDSFPDVLVVRTQRGEHAEGGSFHFLDLETISKVNKLSNFFKFIDWMNFC